MGYLRFFLGVLLIGVAAYGLSPAASQLSTPFLYDGLGWQAALIGLACLAVGVAMALWFARRRRTKP